MLPFKRIVVLAPHPDDGEFGAGASLAKWIEQGAEVFYIAFSPCTASVPEGFEKDVLYKELAQANEHLGIKAKNRICFNFDVRYFPENRQAILEELIKLKKQIQPDLVLLPATTDIHQDHQVISQEGIRAFKHSCLLGYELPWNNISITLNHHVAVEDQHLDKKIAAVNAYESQGFRIYKDQQYIRSWAQFRGVQSGMPMAESFELIRWFQR